jgi:hypothetical protein
MQILGTFQSRDAADAVKDAFVKDGFPLADLIVMSNKTDTKGPPEEAVLEPGKKNEGGFSGLEETIGKAVIGFMHRSDKEQEAAGLDGNGFEGEGRQGAMLGITLQDDSQKDRVIALLERHFAGDIEIAQAD